MKPLKAPVLATLQASSTAMSYRQVAKILNCTVQSAGTSVRKLVAENLAYVHHTKTLEAGGTPEKFFAAGQAPEGYVPPNIGMTPERIAASKEERRKRMAQYHRNWKDRKRKEAAASHKLEYEDPLFIPNYFPQPTSYALGAATLERVWNPNLEKLHAS